MPNSYLDVILRKIKDFHIFEFAKSKLNSQ
jgi:hypothetical protein